MNKLKHSILLSFFISLISVSAYAVDAPGDPGIIKSIKGGRQSEPVRVYKLVRFANRGQNVASLNSNDLVVYDSVSDDGISVNTTTTSADGMIAGIVVTTIQTDDSAGDSSAADDEGRRNWGYILVHGKGTVKVGAGGTNNNSAGDGFITSTDAGSATTVVGHVGVGDRAYSMARGRGGFFYDAAVAADTTAEVFVELE